MRITSPKIAFTNSFGEPIYEDLFIFNFETSMTYIDWNVIFLIMGMMIVIAVVENTGIFQWLAFFAYRVSGGRMWLLLAKLAESAQITEPDNLKKAGMVGGGMLILFITGESFHMLPAVNALIGATALLIWIRPDIEEMIEAVDWTTLVFFMSLFIVVGAIQEVGLISFIADFIANLVGDSLLLAMVTVTWFSAILSTVIANIPFTAAMLPVIGFLTANIPGAQNNALFYCLSVGSAMGGNGSLIGASANMVTAGIADSAGYTISYPYFFKKGFPALLITVSLALIWLIFKFA